MESANSGEDTESRVAFQGEPGAFSSEAGRKLLGERAVLVPCRSFDEMFEAAAGGDVDYCLAPIENSLFGSVYQNYDLLLHHGLRITAEVQLRIVHNLITPPGVALEEVRRVYSHPVALGQCRKFFAAHPELESAPAYDTAGSVKQVMESRERGAAAIASLGAAAEYGAQLLLEGIEDDPQNYTRFWLLAKPERAGEPDGQADKTSVVFALENRAGSLFRAMAVFALRDIDLLKIESRPLVGRPWEYSFYLDFLGHTAEPRVRAALGHLEEFAVDLRVLGCYRRAAEKG
ncbi:MAG: prephenate dehydratase [Acidobacteria bacterium]|nr:prephenate dehydratase [Acidobacteriota bacterium]MCW5971202.1 prephenate dehydratase [Blastocatellales bacterium]